MGETLYQLTDEFIRVKDILESHEGLDQETINETLESLEAPIQAKAENTIKYIKHLESLASAQKEEAKRLAARSKTIENNIEGLLSYLDHQMQKMNVKELEAGIFSLGYRKGSLVTEVDIQKLPAAYWIPQDPKPMGKAELAKRLKEGEVIEGVSRVRNADKLVIK